MFIERLHLEGDEYLFAICNSAFSKSFAPDDINKIISKSGCRLSAYFNLIMPDNHDFVIKEYRPPDKEIFLRCENQAQKRLDHIKEVILKKETYIDRDDRPASFPVLINKVFVPLIFYLIQHHPSILLKGALYSDSKCTGCKICEKVCPANRIVVNGGRPVFDHTKTCFGCYSCVNYCPKESIQVASKWYNGRSYTTINGRYSHPYATAKEIERQKLRQTGDNQPESPGVP
jgi:ferredoxin